MKFKTAFQVPSRNIGPYSNILTLENKLIILPLMNTGTDQLNKILLNFSTSVLPLKNDLLVTTTTLFRKKIYKIKF